MSLFHGGSIVRDGLQLYLDAANSKSYSGSGTTWIDLSGNGRSGTLTNGPTFSSTNNGMFTFDGTDDLCDIASSSVGDFGTNSFTISIWAKASSGSSGSRGVFSKYNPHSGPGTGWFVFLRDGQTTIRVVQDLVEPKEQFQVITTIATNQWYNIVLTRNLYTFSHYINGSLNQSSNSTNIINCSSSGPLRVGSGYVSGYYFLGDVGAAAIYNRALTQTEVTQNFNALRGRYGI